MKKSLYLILVCFGSLSICAQTAEQDDMLADNADASLEWMDIQHFYTENVDTEAQHPKGEKEMNKIISKNLNYPAAARKSGKEGTVVIGIIIDEMGNPVLTSVEKSDHYTLDRAALTAITTILKWEPATKNGIAVRSKKLITVKFSL